jgi:pyruvate formate lyase activating enzyme
MSEKGLISTIQRYSTKDGPGIRSTVFFVGCNLRCKWCANPELMKPGIKYMHFENLCIHCGACVKIAANQSIKFVKVGCVIDRLRCTNIEECMDICPKEAYEKVGYEIRSEDLLEKLLRDALFYEKSGGGVTFSGGEPAFQGDFVIEAANLLRSQGVHVALDTAGYLPWTSLQKVVEAVDMVLYDIKAYDNDIHKACTGVGNEEILDNAKHIARMNKEIIIRMVIVPGWNDDFIDIKKRIMFVKELGSSVTRVDLLRYHNLGIGKYQRLGMKYPLENDIECDEVLLQKIKNLALEQGLNTYLDEKK